MLKATKIKAEDNYLLLKYQNGEFARTMNFFVQVGSFRNILLKYIHTLLEI